jgi:hypothetical protein
MYAKLPFPAIKNGLQKKVWKETPLVALVGEDIEMTRDQGQVA